MASQDRFGLAALSICESLILTLKERGILDDVEVQGLLDDVLAAHRNAAAAGDSGSLHEDVAEVVEEIMKGGNSIRLLRKDSEAAPWTRGRRPARPQKGPGAGEGA